MCANQENKGLRAIRVVMRFSEAVDEQLSGSGAVSNRRPYFLIVGEDLVVADGAEARALEVDPLHGVGGGHGALVVVAVGKADGVAEFVHRLL